MYSINGKNKLSVRIDAVNLPISNYSGCHFQIYEYEHNSESFIMIGNTEKTMNCNNNFQNTIKTSYNLSIQKIVKIALFVDGTEFGSFQINIGDVIASRKEFLLMDQEERKIVNNQGKNTLVYVSTENILSSNATLELKVRGSYLTDNIPSKTKGYKIGIFRKINDSNWEKMYISEEKSRFNSTWKTIKLPTDKLCDDDENKKFIIAILNKSKPIAGTWLTLAHRKELKNTEVILGPIKGVLNRKNSATDDLSKSETMLAVVHFEIFNYKKKFNLISYLKNGQCFTPIYALDFSFPGSEHTLNKNNSFLKTIRSFDQVLRGYYQNTGSMLLGFGAKTDDSKNNCFKISYDNNKKYLESMSEIEKSYKKILYDIVPYKTSLISSVIQSGISYAKKNVNQKNYVLLFILVTNTTMDLQSLKVLLKKMISLPISIFIITIGKENNFKKFKKFFDEKNDSIKNLNIKYENYNEIINKSNESNFSNYLTQKCLENLTSQILNYCKINRITPTTLKSVPSKPEQVPLNYMNQDLFNQVKTNNLNINRTEIALKKRLEEELQKMKIFSLIEPLDIDFETFVKYERMIEQKKNEINKNDKINEIKNEDQIEKDDQIEDQIEKDDQIEDKIEDKIEKDDQIEDKIEKDDQIEKKQIELIEKIPEKSIEEEKDSNEIKDKKPEKLDKIEENKIENEKTDKSQESVEIESDEEENKKEKKDINEIFEEKQKQIEKLFEDLEKLKLASSVTKEESLAI